MKRLLRKILNKAGYNIVRKSDKNLTYVNGIGRMDSLLKLIKRNGLKCETILDVGANDTRWSRMAKEIFPKATFHLIEPQIEMKPHLEAFCEDFSGSSYSLVGVGATKCTLTLTLWEDMLGSSVLPEKKELLINSGKQRPIDIITIDSLIQNKIIKIPDIVKLDIQGFEIEALKGAETTFGKTKAYIIEVSLYQFDDNPDAPLIHDVINFMLSKNYVIYDFPGFLRRPYDNALGQCDICFVKKDSSLRKSTQWS